MLLVCLWWAALVCSYSACLAWLHYDAALLRAADAIEDYDNACEDASVSVLRLVRARRFAALTAVLAFAASNVLLIAHFVTPHVVLRAGPFNTTL